MGHFAFETANLNKYLTNYSFLLKLIKSDIRRLIMKRIYLFLIFLFIKVNSLFAMMGQTPGKPGQTKQGGGFGSLLILFLPLLLIWYFLLIRPQQKKEKEKQKMLSELKKGDKVMTIGGVFAQIIQVKDNRITIKIAEKTIVEVSKTAISGKIDA